MGNGRLFPLFKEVIDNLLLSLYLVVHVVKLLLEPVQLHVGFVKIPHDVDVICSFGVSISRPLSPRLLTQLFIEDLLRVKPAIPSGV